MSRITGAVLSFVVGSLVAAASAADDSQPFAETAVRFEQNATDGDVEVVFEAKAGDEGLAELRIVSPDGRTVVDFEAPDGSTLGIRQFAFESPEPKDVPGLKRAYPEGVYRFSAVSVSGKRFHGEAELSHVLPPVASLLQPGEKAVPSYFLKVSWMPVPDVAAWIVEIEQGDLGVMLKARLPGSARSFEVPNGFMVSGTSYDLSIGSESEAGNRSFVETSFETSGH